MILHFKRKNSTDWRLGNRKDFHDGLNYMLSSLANSVGKYNENLSLELTTECEGPFEACLVKLNDTEGKTNYLVTIPSGGYYMFPEVLSFSTNYFKDPVYFIKIVDDSEAIIQTKKKSHGAEA